MRNAASCFVFLSQIVGCAAQPKQHHAGAPLPPYHAPREPEDIKPAPPLPPLLIRNATVMTAAGSILPTGYVLVRNGRIAEVGSGDGPSGLTAMDAASGGTGSEAASGGKDVDARNGGTGAAGTSPNGTTDSIGRGRVVDDPSRVRVIDAHGGFVTPGIIDTHSHMGVYPQPAVDAHDDGNEATDPTTAEVWAEHAFWPQDPALWRALAGGVTTIQVLPGSANLIGGRSFTAKLKPQISARAMRFPNAPQGLKMACGENPKRVYGEQKHRAPSTRMGNVAGYRREFQKAVEYRRKWQRYARDYDAWKTRHDKKLPPPSPGKADDPPDPVERNLALETLAGVLDGRILVHNHCYRADEMSLMLDLSHEFGFKIRSFHHALEAYKIRQRLAEEDVAVSTWADWWGFKMEAFDGVPQNIAMLQQAGARAVVHSDSSDDTRRLNQEAAKARTAGKRFGIEADDNTVLQWITKNPAWALGIDSQTGTIEVGKMADLVLWDKHPFSVYARTDKVIIDGDVVYDRSTGPRMSDFEVGQ